MIASSLIFIEMSEKEKYRADSNERHYTDKGLPGISP